jgi:hypothetical protein
VHQYGGAHVCGIFKDGTTAFNYRADEIDVVQAGDGYFTASIIYENYSNTISIGTGKPDGDYTGSGTDQYLFKSISVSIVCRNRMRAAVLNQLWDGRDPFDGLPANLFEFDLQGWNSQHPYLREAISILRPELIIEIGVWKGRSATFMANEIKTLGLQSVVVAVDTWLGSSEHWPSDELSFMNGRPALFWKFLSNVLRADVKDYLVPLPMHSLNAAEIFKSRNLRPGIIHIDGGHDYESVAADLRVWWPLVSPGGFMILDDYNDDGSWPGVRKAVDDFVDALGIPIEHSEGKCRIRKLLK